MFAAQKVISAVGPRLARPALIRSAACSYSTASSLGDTAQAAATQPPTQPANTKEERAARLKRRYKNLSAEERAQVGRIVRVNQAGELAADRIYRGQLAVLGNTEDAPLIEEMREQETFHLETFERFIREYRTRPTLLYPIWSLAGFVLGAGTALISKEAAMACTVAVETVIGDHYDSQLRQLLTMTEDPEHHKELRDFIKEFRDDELQHLQHGLDHGAEQAVMYPQLSAIIGNGCKAAIWLAERI